MGWLFVDSFFQEDGIERPSGAVVCPDHLFVREWQVLQEVVPCRLFQGFVTQSPTCIGRQTGNEESALADFPCLLFVVLVVVEPGLVECGMVNHRLHLVQQFEASHDGHEVVGSLQGGVCFCADDACGRVISQCKGALEETLRKRGDGGHSCP